MIEKAGFRRLFFAMKLSYNSPIILTFTFTAIGVFIAAIFNVEVVHYLSCPSSFDQLKGFGSLRLLTYVFVHETGHTNVDYQHILGNFSIILLLGPILEKQYGSFKILLLFALNTLIGGVLHIIFSDNLLIGASGCAYMLIALASMGNFRKGEIPMTFILVALLYFSGEIIGFFNDDNVSRLAHLAGAFVGASYGLIKGSPEQSQQQ